MVEFLLRKFPILYLMLLVTKIYILLKEVHLQMLQVTQSEKQSTPVQELTTYGTPENNNLLNYLDGYLENH